MDNDLFKNEIVTKGATIFDPLLTSQSEHHVVKLLF